VARKEIKAMKKIIVIVFALVLVMSLTLPAVAQPPPPTPIPGNSVDVSTGVNVSGGTTTPPIIKCKWEQDTTALLEDGDPTHDIAGSQFLPPGVYNGTKMVQYWVVVTDPEGVSTVSKVSVDVYHPDGSFKYQVILTKVDKFSVGLPAYLAAKAAGLVTYNTGYMPTGPLMEDDDVWTELDKCTAEVYMGSEVMDYHQPCGLYRVNADAMDNGNAWASENNTDLQNFFKYICVPKFEVDFNALNYGNVSVCSEKWIAGDTVFDDPIAPAPNPNPATVRNIGNIPIKLTVMQTDMGFSHSGATPTAYQGSTPPPDGASNWNVVFDARMGSIVTNGMYYDPLVEVTLPNVLPLCNTDELDFSIHVVKSTAGPHSGTITLGCVPAP
jgi:hypothetical protein